MEVRVIPVGHERADVTFGLSGPIEAEAALEEARQFLDEFCHGYTVRLVEGGWAGEREYGATITLCGQSARREVIAGVVEALTSAGCVSVQVEQWRNPTGSTGAPFLDRTSYTVEEWSAAPEAVTA